MDSKNDITIKQEDLVKLNEAIDKVIEEKKYFGHISWELVEEVCLYYCNNYIFGNVKETEQKVFKIRDMLSITLDFFKSVDQDFYKKIADIVLGKDPQIALSIFKFSEVKDFDEEFGRTGFENFKKYFNSPCNWPNGDKVVVYIPIGWKNEERENNEEKNMHLKKDEGTINDLYILVHELAHTLDTFSEGDKRITKQYSHLYIEGTAIGFERAFTSYLIKRGIIKNMQDVNKQYADRAISTLNKCLFIYSKLAFANIKEKNGIITMDDYYAVINRIKVKNIEYIVLHHIIDDWEKNNNMIIDVRYAFAGAIAPRIEELILKGETDKIKEYIDASKEEQLKKAMHALGIILDENGAELMQRGIRRSIQECKREESKEER